MTDKLSEFFFYYVFSVVFVSHDKKKNKNINENLQNHVRVIAFSNVIFVKIFSYVCVFMSVYVFLCSLQRF